MDGKDTAEIFDLQREREHRVRQATGGSGTTPPSGENWLSKLPESTRFFARNKYSTASEIDDYIISVSYGDVVMLCKNIKGRDVIFEWHDTKLFSKSNEFYLSIKVEHDDNKPVLTGGLDQHAEPEGEHQLPQE